MIKNIDTLGMDTTKYKEILKEIINEVESSTEVSKAKWGNNASMVLICDYAKGIKNLRMLALELSQYEVYFKVMNSCEYLSMKIDKMDSFRSKEEVENYAKEIIESLKAIKFSSTIHYSDEKKIVEKIYDVAYKIIKLEIITLGHSQVYEYIKIYDIDTYFLDKCIRKEVESLNLKNNKNKKIKEKIYEISRDGLDTSYFDIELIKLLICNSDDIDLKDNIIKELNDLKKEINNTVLLGDRTFSRYKYSLEEQNNILPLTKRYKKEIHKRITSTIISLSLIISVFPLFHNFMKKISTKQVYPKNIVTYSDTYGKEVKYDYSDIEDREQDKSYIKVYDEWYKDLELGIVRDIYIYDVSDIKLDNIEDYIEINYEDLKYMKELDYLKNSNDLNQKGYVEVEQIVIDRDKEESFTDWSSYIFLSIFIYSIYISILTIIETSLLNVNGYVGIIHNLYQLLKYNMIDYKKGKSKYKKELKECKKYLNNLLEKINKYENLKTRFNELYNQNKYLLDNPEELLSKIDTLSLILSKEDIKGKLRSLKRY